MVFASNEGNDLYVDCHCGCDSGLRIRIDTLDTGEMYCVVSYTSGDFYRNQSGYVSALKVKLKKIWSIIRNKDFYYSEVCMTKQEFEDFKALINDVK